MKKMQRFISLALAVISVSVTALPMLACGEEADNTQKTSLKFGIDALEGNFNPFFATSASDSQIVAQTQIGMFTTDESGKLVCGDDQPTALLSYKQTMKKGEETTTKASEATSMEYEFVIKNGIKFSDGTPLTIKDVLFNLYVYLDPMYKGTATVSSTKIKGLNAYRWQDPLASDEQNADEGEKYFYLQADTRMINVINHLSDKNAYPSTDEIAADIALIKNLFSEELQSSGTENTHQLDLRLQDLLSTDEAKDILREEMATTIRSAFYDDFKKEHDGLLVKTISGITTDVKIVDDEEHDVVKIAVNGVDSKAIWNFAFPVAPMHYYAGETYADKANGVDDFGVEYSNREFFQNVLQDPAKNGLPMGAGAYQASNSKGEIKGVEAGDFYNGDWVYFTRNNYFNTVGFYLNNAKIKNIWYKVVPSDEIFDSLINREIHVGLPSANLDNFEKIKNYNYLESVTYTANEYGYVGINPKNVPDIEVRQAIMKAMDVASIVKNYYTTDLAVSLHRAMSTDSWAYPKTDGKNVERHKKVAFSRDAEEICALVESAGYRRLDTNSVYAKDGKPLKLTFTIAGDSKDHPAYDMFVQTAEWLNENCGFDITVTTDSQAASKLAEGDLQVWADTRLFDVEPDLYQVYHKDSSAINVENWGYPTILSDTTGQFTYEKGIINQLSTKIEAGLATINRTERTKYYAQALDLIMQLCIELPTYQRKDMLVYNKQFINGATVNKKNASSTLGVFDRIWEVDYK